MKHCWVLLFIYLLQGLTLTAQNKLVVSGPMLGQVELRTARVWIELGADAKSANIRYWKKNNPLTKWNKTFKIDNTADFKPVQMEIGGLDMNTTYEYALVINNTVTNYVGTFTTKELWQWRKPAPDFSFLTGSCSYFNEPIYDRPGKPYGGDSSIFETMAKEKASFMMWLGDNWYTREADYYSEWGLWYRASHDRSTKSLQKFLTSMPHYAIWDDHDYGPNDGDKSYVLKEASRKVFMNYWGNPSYGQNNEAIYSKVTYADCDFFLMDDRWFRSADDMEPFIDGKPNNEKRMWGAKQLEWLKTALINSKTPFKFIVTGSQTLNPASPFDCLQHYPAEFNELMAFLIEEKINGVLFLTGDRHHSEVVKYERPNAYTLYDITSSPLTSGIGRVGGKEKDNPARVAGTLVEAPNYSRISVTGKQKERMLKVEYIGLNGEIIGSWNINENALKSPSTKND
jgi:alkaline phosphatase D